MRNSVTSPLRPILHHALFLAALVTYASSIQHHQHPKSSDSIVGRSVQRQVRSDGGIGPHALLAMPLDRSIHRRRPGIITGAIDDLRDDGTDCQWSNWDEWTECTNSCDGGDRERWRHISVQRVSPGDQCTGSMIHSEVCNEQPCPTTSPTPPVIPPVYVASPPGYDCDTADSGPDCYTCKPKSQRTVENHCASCNSGYEIVGTKCEADPNYQPAAKAGAAPAVEKATTKEEEEVEKEATLPAEIAGNEKKKSEEPKYMLFGGVALVVVAIGVAVFVILGKKNKKKKSPWEVQYDEYGDPIYPPDEGGEEYDADADAAYEDDEDDDAGDVSIAGRPARRPPGRPPAMAGNAMACHASRGVPR